MTDPPDSASDWTPCPGALARLSPAGVLQFGRGTRAADVYRRVFELRSWVTQDREFPPVVRLVEVYPLALLTVHSMALVFLEPHFGPLPTPRPSPWKGRGGPRRGHDVGMGNPDRAEAEMVQVTAEQCAEAAVEAGANPSWVVDALLSAAVVLVRACPSLRRRGVTWLVARLHVAYDLAVPRG